MTASYHQIRDELLEAAITHVPFDGWGAASFAAAVKDVGIDPALAHAVCPRGGLDLALAYHVRGDARMCERLAATDLTEMRFRDRVAAAVRFRLEAVEDRELVRRGMTLFALPAHAPEGARALWQTSDAIWSALGDTSDDLNWYSKRATLSAVYSATVLYWLGDDSPDHAATWAFLDRRVEDVMRFEKMKAQLRENPLTRPLSALAEGVFGRVRAPRRDLCDDLPGQVAPAPTAGR